MNLRREALAITILALILSALGILLGCGGTSISPGLNEALSGLTNPSPSVPTVEDFAIGFKDLSQDPDATLLSSLVDHDDDSTSISLPFDFEMFGVRFPAGIDVYIDTNGLLAFEGDPEYDFDNYSSYENIGLGYELDYAYDNGGPITAIIAPFWDDLETRTLSNAGVYYKVEGTAPNRRLIIQWNTTDYSNEDNILIFQVILFEGTNDIEFAYGHMEDVNGDDWEGSAWDEGSANGLSATIAIGAVDRVNFDYYSMKIAYMYDYYGDGSSQGIEDLQSGEKVIYFKYNPDNGSYTIYEGRVPNRVRAVVPSYRAGSPNQPKPKHSYQPVGYSYKSDPSSLKFPYPLKGNLRLK